MRWHRPRPSTYHLPLGLDGYGASHVLGHFAAHMLATTGNSGGGGGGGGGEGGGGGHRQKRSDSRGITLEDFHGLLDGLRGDDETLEDEEEAEGRRDLFRLLQVVGDGQLSFSELAVGLLLILEEPAKADKFLACLSSISGRSVKIENPNPIFKRWQQKWCRLGEIT